MNRGARGSRQARETPAFAPAAQSGRVWRRGHTPCRSDGAAGLCAMRARGAAGARPKPIAISRRMERKRVDPLETGSQYIRIRAMADQKPSLRAKRSNPGVQRRPTAPGLLRRHSPAGSTGVFPRPWLRNDAARGSDIALGAGASHCADNRFYEKHEFSCIISDNHDMFRLSDKSQGRARRPRKEKCHG